MNEKVQELRETIPSDNRGDARRAGDICANGKSFRLMSEALQICFLSKWSKLQATLASLHNLAIEDAFTKFAARISGEFEPLKSLGIVINEARLKQEAFKLAIGHGTGQMSAAQKALAVQAIVIKDMGDAIWRRCIDGK
jgi:hypothetical protein